MEYPLTILKNLQVMTTLCLNPCSNGIPSDGYEVVQNVDGFVLIPVLMEYPLTGLNVKYL